MEHRNRYDGIHPRAIQFVRYHARQLTRQRAVPGMELEDYEQDLVTDLLARDARFNPARATYPTIAAFKRGEVRALASMGVLTTGFNAPAVDLIAMLRPTKSTGLYVQMAGRGTRLAPGKENCLVLDFAGNVARHGPIDLAKPRDKTNGEGDGEAPTKVCPECQTINALSVRVCIECDYVFPAPDVQLEASATTRPILSTGRPEWIDVGAVTYHRHEKPGKPPSLRVDYHCSLVRHREWVCLEHGGYAGQKALRWWRRRAEGAFRLPPSTRRSRAPMS